MHEFEKYGELALEKIEEILDKLNISYAVRSNIVQIICPIHGSESMSSSSIRLDNGAWKCWSRNCDRNDGLNSTFLSLIRWSLSQNNESGSLSLIDWPEVFSFVESLILKSPDQLTKRKKRDISDEPLSFLDEDEYPAIKLPSPYFMRRGFSADILNKYKIGNGCFLPYIGRAIVPIRYTKGELMGFSSRSIYDECPKCRFYHSKLKNCVTHDFKYASFYSKWVHSKGTRKLKTLYNIENLAAANTKKVVLTEGPSCVWRLDPFNIFALSCLGKDFSADRVNLLKSFGVEKILFMPDNDEAGKEFKTRFINKYSNKFDIHCPILTEKDVTAMSNSDIENNIVKVWNKI